MTTWEAILLGIVQGLTEFLPISSSGHLELAQALLGFQNLHHYVLFNLICHLGTLCAIFYIFYQPIKRSLTEDRKRLLQVVIGTLPLFPLVLILKPIKALFDQPQYLGFFFLFSSLLLFLGTYWRLSLPTAYSRRWKDPLTIGLFQAVAILPGVSRSGSTISAARLLGWQQEEAVTFSFLLAIPAILGGMVLETGQVIFKAAEIAPISFAQFTAGFFTSFLVGALTLEWLKRLVANNRWVYFAWYCLFIGVASLIYFNM